MSGLSTYCPRCKRSIDGQVYFSLSSCPYCAFDFSRSRNRFTFVLFGSLVALIWTTYAFKPGVTASDRSLVIALTGGLAFLTAWYYRKERMLRKRESVGARLPLLTTRGIAAFWQRETRTGRPSGAHQMYTSLGLRAGLTAEGLRERWLTRDRAELLTKLAWAETNLPEACLFAEVESTILQMAATASRLFTYNFGGLQGTDAIVNAHAQNLRELSRLHTKMRQRLQTTPSSIEIGKDLEALTLQIEAVLKHVNRMYA